MDRVSSCNIYVIQQDTQCFMIEFIHNTWWIDMFRALNGPSSGTFTRCMLQIWYVAICVLLETSRCYAVYDSITYQICNIQLVNAPGDGPLRAETCRSIKRYE